MRTQHKYFRKKYKSQHITYFIITPSDKDRKEETMDVNKNIARRFNELCREKGMTLQEVSAHSGISVRSLKRVQEGDLQRLGVTNVHRICCAFNVTLGVFF